MASKRMLSRVITDSDIFMNMPASSQSLYFHLCLRADDDGFMSQLLSTMRALQATNKDLDILISNSLIIYFESEICVITHWFIHNNVRKDRKIPTLFKNELKKMFIEDNIYKIKQGKNNKDDLTQDKSNKLPKKDTVDIYQENNINQQLKDEKSMSASMPASMSASMPASMSASMPASMPASMSEQSSKVLKYLSTNTSTSTKNNNKEINKEKEKKEKSIYGELKNVSLSDEEYKKIKLRNLDRYLENLSLYISSTGKKYKSHYATILTWAEKDKKEKEAIKNEKLNTIKGKYADIGEVINTDI